MGKNNKKGKSSSLKSGLNKFNPKLKSRIKKEKKSKEDDHILKDDRFAKIATDPRFHGIPAQERKVQIDSRFQSMFTDKKFNQKHSVDKRGRPVNFSSADNLERFYQIEGGSSTKESIEKNVKESGYLGKKKAVLLQTSHARFQQLAEEKTIVDFEFGEDDPSLDLARGQGNVSSSSDSESSDDEADLDNTPKIEHSWAEFANDALETEEISRRLAMVNMDWDNVRAEDIFALMNSFKPVGGLIKSVTVYLSDYGAERLEHEKLRGPIQLDQSKVNNSDDMDSGNEDLAEANEQLRQYQLNKLRYYYAVIECDSNRTAEKIYEECDGLEYGNSSARVDLRFISDDMTFDREPKSIAVNLPANFTPNVFVITALQQSKVKCSWDETPRDRLKLNKLDWTKTDDLKTFIASSSEEEEDSEEFNVPDFDNRSVRSARDPGLIEKYRSLIQEIDEQARSKEMDESDEDIDMEVQWQPELKQSATGREKEKRKDAVKHSMTPFEKILEKQKQKRSEKRSAKREKNPTMEEAWEKDESDDLEDSDNDTDNDESEDDQHSPVSEATNEVSAESGNDGSQQHDNSATKADLELLVGKSDGKKHFSLKKLMSDAKDTKSQRKRKRKLQIEVAEEEKDDFKIDIQDDRFSALFTSSHYNLDLSDPSFKRTKVMDAIVKEKQKRKLIGSTDDQSSQSVANRKLRPELTVLAKAVKAKLTSGKNSKK